MCGCQQTYNKANVSNLSDSHIDLLPLIDRQADVEEVVLVGHAPHFHERHQVAVIVTAIIIMGLEKT